MYKSKNFTFIFCLNSMKFLRRENDDESLDNESNSLTNKIWAIFSFSTRFLKEWVKIIDFSSQIFRMYSDIDQYT